MAFLNFMLDYGLLIVSIFVTFVSVIFSLIKDKNALSSKKLAMILNEIPSLVVNAEITYGKGKGTAKLDYVLTKLRLLALQNNVAVTDDVLVANINNVVDATKYVNTENVAPTKANEDNTTNVAVNNQTFHNI